jgi:large subunit ribosomal protein L23Ae
LRRQHTHSSAAQKTCPLKMRKINGGGKTACALDKRATKATESPTKDSITSTNISTIASVLIFYFSINHLKCLLLVSIFRLCSFDFMAEQYFMFLSAKTKATKAAGALKKGSGRKATRVHTKVHFYRPQTLKLARNPKFNRTVQKSMEGPKEFDVIKYPLNTESAMKKIEENNTLVFIVNITANKRQIKDAVKKIYDIKADKVNTLIRYILFQIVDNAIDS